MKTLNYLIHQWFYSLVINLVLEQTNTEGNLDGSDAMSPLMISYNPYIPDKGTSNTWIFCRSRFTISTRSIQN